MAGALRSTRHFFVPDRLPLLPGRRRPNVALGASDAPNATLGALNAPNATLGRSGLLEEADQQVAQGLRVLQDPVVLAREGLVAGAGDRRRRDAGS